MVVKVGDQLPTWEVASVDAARMKTMAVLLKDPNPIHFDIASVIRLGMGDRLVNQGPNNVGYLFNLLISWLGDPSAVEQVRVRFRANVLEGDRLLGGGEVRSIDEDGPTRRATCDVWLDREDGTRVVAGSAVVRLPTEE
jgi:acyl dehydratase